MSISETNYLNCIMGINDSGLITTMQRNSTLAKKMKYGRQELNKYEPPLFVTDWQLAGA